MKKRDKLGHFVKGYHPSPKTEFKKGEKKEKHSPSEFKKGNAINIGRKHSDATRRKISFAHCGKELSEDHRRKLSNAHRGLLLGDKHPNWKGGKSIEFYPPTFNQQLKDKIRVRDNFICQECGVPELECNRRLNVHHIDYNKKNCNEDNLISLCSSCNSKANKNRLYWKKLFEERVKQIN